MTIPEGVTAIGKYAFCDCTKLYTVNLPGSLAYIDSGAFEYCLELEDITLPEGLTIIGDSAFCCSHLLTIAIPGSVQEIGRFAFSSCAALQELILSPGLMSIGPLAFSFCQGLTEVVIPDTVTSIGNYAFSDCTALENVTLPGGPFAEGEDVFRNTPIQEHALEAFPQPDSQAPIAGPNDPPLPEGTRVYAEDQSLASLLPESVRAINPIQADYLLVRDVRKYSLSNYSGPAYETETSVYLCGRDGSAVFLCRISNMPPERGWVAEGDSLDGDVATFGEIWEQIDRFFPADK